jgi:N-dimethylarginine dimethylaminohydrolase
MTASTVIAERKHEVVPPEIGRRPARLLMCAPTAYALLYEINPWMSLANRPDTALAERQWSALYRTLTEEVGAVVELIPQTAGCPDMVFTANAGVVRGQIALLANFRHPQRQPEEAEFGAWFETHGCRVIAPSASCRFEGEGDALFAGETVIAGYLKRSDIGAHRWLSEALETPVLSVQLVDDRWYHLDTCLFPLNAQTLVYFPGAFDDYAQRVLNSNFETIAINEEEALRFACNAVVIDNHVVLPSGCPELMTTLEARGYFTHSIDMSEFLKAGGACKCLTLFLR